MRLDPWETAQFQTMEVTTWPSATVIIAPQIAVLLLRHPLVLHWLLRLFMLSVALRNESIR